MKVQSLPPNLGQRLCRMEMPVRAESLLARPDAVALDGEPKRMATPLVRERRRPRPVTRCANSNG